MSSSFTKDIPDTDRELKNTPTSQLETRTEASSLYIHIGLNKTLANLFTEHISPSLFIDSSLVYGHSNPYLNTTTAVALSWSGPKGFDSA